MAVDIFNDVVSSQEREILLDYINNEEDSESIDQRPDVRTKIPDIVRGKWPKEIVKSILDRALNNYDLEQLFFYDSKISFRVHVDSGDGDQEKLHKNVLIPLYSDGISSTVVFKNKWYGPSTRFNKEGGSPFTYSLLTKTGEFIEVPDIRELTIIDDFDITREELDKLIAVRSPDSKNPPDQRTYDYSNIEGYDPNLKFDKDIHQKWLNHISIEDLHGLTVEKIIEWNLGDLITFDRQHLHCAGSGHKRKKALTIFTTRYRNSIVGDLIA